MATLREKASRRAERAGLRALSRALLRRARSRAASVRMVLVYHGVRAPGDAEGGHPPKLDPALFAAHLDHLAADYEVVALRDLLAGGAQAAGHGPVRVALTFDDDLRAHATVAAPMLRERGLTATFFLTGSALGGEFSNWWLDLEAIAGRDAWPAVRDELAGTWPWVARTEPESLATTMMRLPPAERARVAAELRRLSGGAGADPGLGAGEIRELAAHGFEIGFHTRRHEPLDTLDPGELAAAMTDGLDELAEVAGTRPEAISYPHGRTDVRVAHAAAEAGFRHGFGLGDDRALRAGDDPLLLPRIDPYSGALAVESFGFRLARIAFAAARRT